MVEMVFKNLCVLVLLMKVASAFARIKYLYLNFNISSGFVHIGLENY